MKMRSLRGCKVSKGKTKWIGQMVEKGGGSGRRVGGVEGLLQQVVGANIGFIYRCGRRLGYKSVFNSIRA